ncbi:MAG: hypothetical protein ACT4PZ_22160 [Panacagrimonas sp.]
MDTQLAGIFELSLVFGSLLLFLIWELVLLRRSQRRDEEKEKAAQRESLSQDDSKGERR